MSDKLAPAERHRFEANGSVGERYALLKLKGTFLGQLVYEWDQTLTDVNVYVPVPPGTKGKDLYCEIKPESIRIGMHSNPPYLSESFCDKVAVSDCLWTLGNNKGMIMKAKSGETWRGVFERHALQEAAVEADKKRLILERFQAEHAGFDFSGAEVTGAAPNARTFLKDEDE